MRMLFTLVGLIVVVAVVMKLGATQLAALKPAARPVPAGAAPADATTAAPGPAGNPARDIADRMRSAVEQGAAARAADAASR